MLPSVPLGQARAFVLVKQGLAGVGCPSVHDATLATAGVYGTAPTCYLSHAARIPGFRLADLDEELYRRRRLVRLRCMRGSSYIEPVDRLGVVLAGSGPGLNATERLVRLTGVTEEAFTELSARVEEVLAGRPPATMPELRELLGGGLPTHRDALRYVVALMCAQARLVRADVRGTWRSDIYTYARWSDWIGEAPQEIEPEPARTALARHYLRAFGPASVSDLKWWAGWNARQAKAAVAALGDEVTAVTLTGPDGPPAEAFVLTDEQPALLAADPEDVRGTRLLPVWDAYLMGYIDRRRLVAEADYPRIYDRAGNSTSVLAVNGIAAGVWEADYGTQLTVRVAPFGQPVAAWWTDVEAAAGRLAEAISAGGVRVERAPQPGSLADGTRNAFLAPIRLGARS